jgi:AcrR family transcriptional regulator
VPPRPNSSPDEILVITIQLISEFDVSGVSVDMVAERAGVSKATIYRRWPSREELIFEAVSYIKYPQASPDTGSVREDLAILLDGLVHFLNRPDGGKVYAAFLNAAIRNPKLAALRREVSQAARIDYHAAVRRGIERGELRPDANAELLVELMIAPFIYRRIGDPGNVPQEMVGEVLGIALDGCLAQREAAKA